MLGLFADVIAITLAKNVRVFLWPSALNNEFEGNFKGVSRGRVPLPPTHDSRRKDPTLS